MFGKNINEISVILMIIMNVFNNIGCLEFIFCNNFLLIWIINNIMIK